MSSSESPSSSSPSSSSSSNGNGKVNGRRSRGGSSYEEGPSRRARAAVNEVWPEPFLEALAAQVATHASTFFGRLAAAQALANLFQVCSTWRAVSRSDPLWNRLTHLIWGGPTGLLHPTWRDQFIHRHRTALNFRSGSSLHFTLHFVDLDDANNPDALICRTLCLSDLHLAAGFADGTLRLFNLQTRLHARTFRPQHRDLLGRFSRAVSGIIITGTRLVFATLDGDIHVVANVNSNVLPRRARLGDVINDGALVDFTGSGGWWVGLYAGVPGRAFRVWDGNTEDTIFEGGSLTDPQAVMGWHTLAELTEFVGRVRVTSLDSAVACTSSRVMVFDLENIGALLGEPECRRGVMVGCVDVWEEAYIVVDGRGWASVRRVRTSEEVCRFNVYQHQQGGRGTRGAQRVVVVGSVMGCMNGGYALMCAGGVMKVWEIEQRGEHLYNLEERIGEVNAMVADERHVAAASNDTTIHLWDFGAQ